MRIDVFKKTKTTKKGKKFDVYLSKLTNKTTGEFMNVQVKYVGQAQTDIENSNIKYPVTLDFDKTNANLSTKEITTDNGKKFVRRTLWISNINKIEQFVDNSLTDFE